MLALGFIIGAALAAPVFFALGRIAKLDSHVTHQRADITPALRRSVR